MEVKWCWRITMVGNGNLLVKDGKNTNRLYNEG
jgi:hypothetical protein